MCFRTRGFVHDKRAWYNKEREREREREREILSLPVRVERKRGIYLLVFHTHLQDEVLILVVEGFGEAAGQPVETGILPGLNSFILLRVSEVFPGCVLPGTHLALIL